MRYAFPVLFLIASIGANAQGTGHIRLLVDPGHNYEFVLDEKYRMQKRELELIEGPHRLQVWAPTRSIIDTTITVKAGSLQEVLLRLPYSPEYVAYKNEVDRMTRKQWVYRAVPVALTVGTAAFAAVAYTRHRKAYDRLQEDEAAYRSLAVPEKLTELKTVIIPEHKEDLDRTRTTFTVASGLFAVAAAGTIYSFIRTGKQQVPVFEDAEKIRFDGLVWLNGPNGGTWAAGATIPLR